MPFGNRKIYFRRSFQFSLVIQIKKYHPSGNLKFNNLGFPKLEIAYFNGKKFFKLKLNFTPNTLGCYGLKNGFKHYTDNCASL